MYILEWSVSTSITKEKQAGQFARKTNGRWGRRVKSLEWRSGLFSAMLIV